MFVSCPNCGSLSTIPIAYGKPSHEVEEASKRGLVRLAGCIVDEGDPTRHCVSCQHEWQYLSSERARYLDEGEKLVFGVYERLETYSIDAVIDAAIRYGKSISSPTTGSPETFHSVLHGRAECLRPLNELLEAIRRELRGQGRR